MPKLGGFKDEDKYRKISRKRVVASSDLTAGTILEENIYHLRELMMGSNYSLLNKYAAERRTKI